ncbi:SDR family NAD(P)-dependent oxidoreductase [Micromonospora chokoriensis]
MVTTERGAKGREQIRADLRGTVAVVTGANSGVGFHTAKALVTAGATVVMACRNRGRMAAAARLITAKHPGSAIRQVRMDLGNLRTVGDAAAQILDDHGRVDILINNAGLLAAPHWLTYDGVELHFGVNHLGHFAFAAHLIPGLLAAPTARVVTVSSTAHRAATLDLDNWPRPAQYRPQKAYAASKLANLLFAYELHRLAARADVSLRSISCHPGWSDTELLTSAQRSAERRVALTGLRMMASIVAQPAEHGANAAITAACADVASGVFLGPSRWWHTRGPITTERSSDDSYREDAARQLWEMSVDLSRVDPRELLRETVVRGPAGAAPAPVKDGEQSEVTWARSRNRPHAGSNSHGEGN